MTLCSVVSAMFSLTFTVSAYRHICRLACSAAFFVSLSDAPPFSYLSSMMYECCMSVNTSCLGRRKMSAYPAWLSSSEMGR